MLIFALAIWGFAIGWVAFLIVNPRKPVNWGRALAAGWLGSFLGGLASSLIAGDGLALKMSGIIGSIIGAIVVLAIWGVFDRKHDERVAAERAAAKKAAKHGPHTDKRVQGKNVKRSQ